jgi:hypothetical protein
MCHEEGGLNWTMCCFTKTMPGLTQVQSSDAIARLGFKVLPQPVYSLHLAPSNFHLFPTP